MNIGFIGYSDETKYVESTYKHFVDIAFENLYNTFPNKTFKIVAGLTDVGISKLVYKKAEELKLETIGFACEKYKNYPCFDVDKKYIHGNDWGDESTHFLEYLDCLVRIGGGKQSSNEVEIAKNERKIYVFEYDSPDFK